MVSSCKKFWASHSMWGHMWIVCTPVRDPFAKIKLVSNKASVRNQQINASSMMEMVQAQVWLRTLIRKIGKSWWWSCRHFTRQSTSRDVTFIPMYVRAVSESIFAWRSSSILGAAESESKIVPASIDTLSMGLRMIVSIDSHGSGEQLRWRVSLNHWKIAIFSRDSKTLLTRTSLRDHRSSTQLGVRYKAPSAAWERAEIAQASEATLMKCADQFVSATSSPPCNRRNHGAAKSRERRIGSRH